MGFLIFLSLAHDSKIVGWRGAPGACVGYGLQRVFRRRAPAHIACRLAQGKRLRTCQSKTPSFHRRCSSTISSSTYPRMPHNFELAVQQRPRTPTAWPPPARPGLCAPSRATRNTLPIQSAPPSPKTRKSPLVSAAHTCSKGARRRHSRCHQWQSGRAGSRRCQGIPCRTAERSGWRSARPDPSWRYRRSGGRHTTDGHGPTESARCASATRAARRHLADAAAAPSWPKSSWRRHLHDGAGRRAGRGAGGRTRRAAVCRG